MKLISKILLTGALILGTGTSAFANCENSSQETIVLPGENIIHQEVQGHTRKVFVSKVSTEQILITSHLKSHWDGSVIETQIPMDLNECAFLGIGGEKYYSLKVISIDGPRMTVSFREYSIPKS